MSVILDGLKTISNNMYRNVASEFQCKFEAKCSIKLNHFLLVFWFLVSFLVVGAAVCCLGTIFANFSLLIFGLEFVFLLFLLQKNQMVRFVAFNCNAIRIRNESLLSTPYIRLQLLPRVPHRPI